MWHQLCQRCKYTTSVVIEKLVSRVKLHASAVSLLESGEYRCVKAINNIKVYSFMFVQRLEPHSRRFRNCHYYYYVIFGR